MQLPSKNPQEYNAKDIFNIFSTLYYDKFGYDYVIARFIGHEMHLIKEALIKHGGYKIACATYNGIRANDRSVNVPYIMAGLKYYIPTTSAKIYWFIHMDGTVDMKKKWKRGEILGATWLPSATQHIQLKEISDELRTWANAKEKTYVGTVTKKRGKSKPI